MSILIFQLPRDKTPFRGTLFISLNISNAIRIFENSRICSINSILQLPKIFYQNSAIQTFGISFLYKNQHFSI